MDIQILDGAKTIGAKILVSGGGRCNVTHGVITTEDFHGTPHLIRNILAAFPVESTIEWFASMGVELKREDTGKLFPTTDKARTVLNALLRRCQDLGVFIRTSHRVTDIVRIGGSEKATEEECQVFNPSRAGRSARKAGHSGNRRPLSGTDRERWVRI